MGARILSQVWSLVNFGPISIASLAHLGIGLVLSSADFPKKITHTRPGIPVIMVRNQRWYTPTGTLHCETFGFLPGAAELSVQGVQLYTQYFPK